MSTDVIYLPEARDDIDEAYWHYEQRLIGLGERFLEQLQIRIEAIADNPEMYAVVEENVRPAPLSRFPYVVYYRSERGIVFVLAVLHGGRDQREWKRRAER